MNEKAYAVRMASWAKIIAEVNNSGVTKTRWCQEHGIRPRQFHYWQKRIREFMLEHPDTTIADLSDAESDIPAVSGGQSFCEIQLSGDAAQPPFSHLQGTAPCPALMLQINDLQLYINNGFSEAALSSVIRVIRNA